MDALAIDEAIVRECKETAQWCGWTSVRALIECLINGSGSSSESSKPPELSEQP